MCTAHKTQHSVTELRLPYTHTHIHNHTGHSPFFLTTPIIFLSTSHPSWLTHVSCLSLYCRSTDKPQPWTLRFKLSIFMCHKNKSKTIKIIICISGNLFFITTTSYSELYKQSISDNNLKVHILYVCIYMFIYIYFIC